MAVNSTIRAQRVSPRPAGLPGIFEVYEIKPGDSVNTGNATGGAQSIVCEVAPQGVTGPFYACIYECRVTGGVTGTEDGVEIGPSGTTWEALRGTSSVIAEATLNAGPVLTTETFARLITPEAPFYLGRHIGNEGEIAVRGANVDTRTLRVYLRILTATVPFVVPRGWF